MNILETAFEGLYEILPTVHLDQRGYFLESFNQTLNAQLNTTFIQDNESMSLYGTLRGLHYQKEPFSQSKLVRVVKGEVLDVVVDLRPNSNTFSKHFSTILNDKNKKQLFIPKGFAHGFIVLSSNAIFSYKVDNIYSPKEEIGIIWNDKKLNIDWKLKENEIIVSEKDKHLTSFNECINLL
ncbi:MAG: dTDP-4-dehydrorhamnose 3,5-epimerase [Flavobacteriia bacterium]|nr:dTDP-4-dehydrorhamnose 3,5-epimerase [Flavobacteriia bacterium]